MNEDKYTMKLPYGIWPGHWGLKGKTREIARAEYELVGESLERKMIEINSENDEELSLKNLKIDRKYNRITKEEYDYKHAELVYTDGHEGTLAKLELDKKYGKITESEYVKALYSLNGDPWVGVIGSEFNPDGGTSGFSFELDWNQAFVDMCVEAGYNGSNEEQIVEQWFEDVATEEYYKEMLQGDQSFIETGGGNLPPITRTEHERIDGTKTKHS